MAGAEMHRDIQALTGQWSSGPPLPSLDLQWYAYKGERRDFSVQGLGGSQKEQRPCPNAGCPNPAKGCAASPGLPVCVLLPPPPIAIDRTGQHCDNPEEERKRI